MSVPEWSYEKVTIELRRAGWRSLGHFAYGYTDENGRLQQIGLMSFVDGRILWRQYAEVRRVPAPGEQ